jgi:PAS domain S-box-containing protein
MFAAVFIVLIALTQFLAYQQYKISQAEERTELVHEAAVVKDRFRGILFNDIAAANTLAIIYKQYGVTAKFDSIASQIIARSRYAKVLQITERGIVKAIYPNTPNKRYIGVNTLHDPMRRAEAERTVEKKDIYFAGPRKLRNGGIGILGKVPIVVNNEVKAIAVVQTNLPDIIKSLEPAGAGKNKFAYQLLKINGNDTSSFELSSTKPDDRSESVSGDIPEGDWVLRVSYAEGYAADKFPFELSGLGILFSLAAALLAYRKAREPYKLNEIIDDKTAQLARSEKYFRTLIETSSDALVLLDAEGKLLYQTPSAEKILGYSQAEMQEIDGLELIHPDDREGDSKMFEELLNSVSAFINREHRIKHKNGNYIQIEGTYRNLLNDENVKAIVYNYKDVTEKTLSKQNLLESETRFRRAFEDSAIGMGLVSLEGKWIKVNRSLYEMLGYTEKQLLSLTFQQITHPDDLEKDLEFLSRTLRGEIDTYRMEKRYFNKRGGIIWVNLNVSIIRDTDKRPTYFVSQIENITDKVLSVQSLAQYNRELTLLNKINDIILRADDELQLYEEACDCIVTVGNYELAWICDKPDADAADQTVVPLIAIGATEYLSGVKIVLNDPDLANGSTGIVLHTGKNASMFGIRSSIALPLNLGHNKSGALTIYAGQVDAFDENEISTLNRLAASLSLAVLQIRNREELVESENRFRSAFEDSAIGMGLTSIEEGSMGRWLKVNKSLYEMLGYTPEELTSLTFMQITHPDDLARDLAAQDRVLQGELDTYRLEKRYIHKNGSIVWINLNVSVIKDKDNRPVYLVAQVENITERKTVYDELKRSEAKLKSIFDTTDVSYLLLDKNYNIVALNQHMKDAYIAAAGVALYEGADLMELMPREKQEKARAVYDKVVKDNNALDYETTYIRDGVSMHFLANVKPINDGKKVIGLCISTIDITERKNALEQLKQVNKNLQKKAKELAVSNAELERFAYVASHDLQEPLGMVTGFLTQLERKYGAVLDEKAKKYIYFATDGAKRMRQLILDLLEYSRAGQTEDNLEEVDFNKLVSEVLIFFRQNIEETNAVVSFNGLPILNVYKPPMRQVFQNLLGNALKYHESGASPIVEISCIERETGFEFVVSDNGIGIDSDYFEQIFIIFKRLHNRGEYEGTGMGLAITKKIIEHMGGKIWVTSKENTGSAFHFTLPKHIML